MRVVKESFIATTEERGSKFIAHLCPYAKFETLMHSLRSTHPKAVHFVYAYRYINEFDQIVENSSDDGEPRGTSGKPTLSALAGADLVDSAVIVVRYFGGTKLGTGGLVRAYSSSVNAVIDVATTHEYKKVQTVVLKCGYDELRVVEYTLEQENIKVTNKSFDEAVLLHLELSSDELEHLRSKLPRSVDLSLISLYKDDHIF